jgi:GNAT superfamily N-acetyltransferase
MSRERDRTLLTLSAADREGLLDVVNTAAERYAGIVPPESDTDPYMSASEVERAMAGMEFLGAVEEGTTVGVVGVQERADVSLIRHLYVRPEVQRTGVGTTLLEAAIDRADAATVLVGTWRAAEWAIAFYEANGFEYLGHDRDLLTTYWEIPDHQADASVVLRYRTDPNDT